MLNHDTPLKHSAEASWANIITACVSLSPVMLPNECLISAYVSSMKHLTQQSPKAQSLCLLLKRLPQHTLARLRSESFHVTNGESLLTQNIKFTMLDEHSPPEPPFILFFLSFSHLCTVTVSHQLRLGYFGLLVKLEKSYICMGDANSP